MERMKFKKPKTNEELEADNGQTKTVILTGEDVLKCQMLRMFSFSR
jgi:hypothetical protein